MTGELSELYAWSSQGPSERELSMLGDQASFLIGSMHRDTAQQLVRVSSDDHRHFVPSEVPEKVSDILACGTQVIFIVGILLSVALMIFGSRESVSAVLHSLLPRPRSN
jgi:hypothetical protein